MIVLTLWTDEGCWPLQMKKRPASYTLLTGPHFKVFGM